MDRKWSKKELFGRVVWGLCHPLFSYSPRICWGWRRFLLRAFGAKIGRQVQIHPTVRVFIPWNLEIGDWSSAGFDVILYNLGALKIGEKVTISQRAHLCGGSHDYRDPSMPLLKAFIEIEDEVWICADAFIGPNVTVRKSAVVGARAVLLKSCEVGDILGGNPAKVIGKR